jgi:hypothetical protein
MKKIAIIASLACVVLLSSCLIPERFTAKVDIQADASYTFVYAGTAVHGLAAAKIKKAGTLSEKDQMGLKKETERLLKNPDVQNAVYKGNGRYELKIEGKRKTGQTLNMFDIFSVSTDKNGIMTIASKEIKEKGQRELEQLGISVDGTLEVRLPKNAEIISHNASSKPSFFGLFSTYNWKIGDTGQRPMMKIKFNH